MTENELKSYFNAKNFDIRIHNNARWIDQKCTPDVISIVADCIINYLDECGDDKEFTSNDIWLSDYASVIKSSQTNCLRAFCQCLKEQFLMESAFFPFCLFYNTFPIVGR